MADPLPVLVLFDVDLTLIATGGNGLRALRTAFGAISGLNGRMVMIRPDGKTDPSILAELCAANGVPHSNRLEAEFRRIYLERLRIETVGRGGGRLCDGIPALLDRLGAMPGVRLGLVTGNYEAGARIKLEPFDLNRRFPTGAFGSDHSDRSRLPPLALARAGERYSLPFSPDRTVVIGDTIHDVRCGQANGMSTVAVASGTTPRDELACERPDLLLDSLAEQEPLLELVGRLGAPASDNRPERKGEVR